MPTALWAIASKEASWREVNVTTLDAAIAKVEGEHAEPLRWFRDHAGQTVGWQEIRASWEGESLEDIPLGGPTVWSAFERDRQRNRLWYVGADGVCNNRPRVVGIEINSTSLPAVLTAIRLRFH